MTSLNILVRKQSFNTFLHLQAATRNRTVRQRKGDANILLNQQYSSKFIVTCLVMQKAPPAHQVKFGASRELQVNCNYLSQTITPGEQRKQIPQLDERGESPVENKSTERQTESRKESWYLFLNPAQVSCTFGFSALSVSHETSILQQRCCKFVSFSSDQKGTQEISSTTGVYI